MGVKDLFKNADKTFKKRKLVTTRPCALHSEIFKVFTAKIAPLRESKIAKNTHLENYLCEIIVYGAIMFLQFLT